MSSDTTIESEVSRRQAIQTAGAAAATVATAGIAATPASAYHEGQTLEKNEGFFGGSDVVNDDSLVAAMVGSSKGRYRRLQLRFEELGDAEEIAADLQGNINEHSEEYLAYVNDRDLGESGREVLMLTVAQDDGEVVLYLAAEYADGAYKSLELLAEETYTEEHGGREPDEEAVLEGHAAKEAPEDLDRLYEEFIEPNEDISVGFASEMVNKYATSHHVTSTLLGDDL